jgi:cyclic-di-GMP-binding protein
MKLPELSPGAEPQFVDAASCKSWLDHVALANVAAAQQQLLDELAEFNRFPTSAANRFGAMEGLREAVNFVQIEQAKRFTNRALPMNENELSAFDLTGRLWDQMRLGYLRCLDAAVGNEPAMQSQAAVICQRLLAYSGLKMFHCYRAYREVEARDWRSLHQIYAHAEKLGVAEEAVKDFLNRDVHDTSPRIAYARAVLTGLANPNELAQRQLTFVAFLLERWASKVEVSRTPVDEGEGVPPLVASLASDRPPERIEAAAAAKTAEARYLDTRKLAKSLRNRVGLLRKGESPAKLMLGEDCVQPSCEQALVFLYRQWCQAKPARVYERRASSTAAQVTNELATIHHAVAGRPFRQPTGEQKEFTQKQRQELETLGRIRTTSNDASDSQPLKGEAWEIVDESAQGLRMVRRAGSAGRRYAHGQLLAVQPADAKGYMLGQVRWLMATENGDLHAGAKVLPGVPAAVAVRASGLNVQDAHYLPVIGLAAVPALDAPASLILPPGWFKSKRVIELYVSATARVRLTGVLERGLDYERVAFENV